MTSLLDYALLHGIHVTAVTASGTLFLLRGGAMLLQHDGYRRGLLRWLPHAVDSVLLLSAIGMLLWVSGAWLSQPWLLAKLAALPLYVVLGSIALKRGRSLAQRAAAFVAAVLVFAYIVSVALTRSPLPGLAGG